MRASLLKTLLPFLLLPGLFCTACKVQTPVPTSPPLSIQSTPAAAPSPSASQVQVNPPSNPISEEKEATEARQYLEFLRQTHTVALQTLKRTNPDTPFSEGISDRASFVEAVRQEQIRDQDNAKSWKQFTAQFEQHPYPASCRTLALEYDKFLQQITLMLDEQVWALEFGTSNSDVSRDRLRTLQRDIPAAQQRCVAQVSVTNAAMDEVCSRYHILSSFHLSGE